MVPVYIRPESDAAGTLLGRFDPADFDRLVQAVRHWGCDVAGNNAGDAYGQFFVNNGQTGFEVVLVEP